jgi:hypothetical protein
MTISRRGALTMYFRDCIFWLNDSFSKGGDRVYLMQEEAKPT